MRNISTNKLQDFFNIYLKYIEHDLSNSMFDNSNVGRNIDIIILLQDTLYLMLVGESIEKEDWEKTKSDLNAAIDSYMKNSRHLSKNRSLKLSNIDDKVYELFDDELGSLIKEHKIASKDFSQYLPHLHLPQETIDRFAIHNENNVLVQAMLEFNNALAHLAVVVYFNHDELGNIKKAKSHIYRGILDYYKMLLRFMMSRLNMTEELIQQYHQIRVDEFLLLGKDVSERIFDSREHITTRYKEFFNECLNKLGIREKQSSAK